MQQPPVESLKRLSPPLSVNPPDLYRKGDFKQSSMFKTRLSPIRQELLRNQPMNMVGLEAQRTLAQRIAILDYKGSLAGGSLGQRASIAGPNDYEANPLMAKLHEKLQLRDMFKDEKRSIEREETGGDGMPESQFSTSSPERAPCTLLDESVTKSLR